MRLLIFSRPYADRVTGADVDILQWIARHRFAAMTSFANGVMHIAGDKIAVLAIAIVCIAYVVVARRYRLAAGFVVGVVAAWAASLVLKSLFGVHRPPPSSALVYAQGSSFPSTDAAITAAAAAAILVGATWLTADMRRRVGWALGVVVAVVGFLLVYLGAHWPTDVLAGWLLGTIVGGGVAVVAQRFSRTFRS